MTQAIALHLDQTHGIKLRLGDKGECPLCRRDTFSISKDGTIGKCFHPSCGKYITEASLARGYDGTIHQILATIQADCHRYLCEQGRGTAGAWDAWRFLVEKRNALPSVIHDMTDMGAVSPNYDMAAVFAPAVAAIDKTLAELQEKVAAAEKCHSEANEKKLKEAKAVDSKARKPAASKPTAEEQQWAAQVAKLSESRSWLLDQQAALTERCSITGGWLAFFHTDAAHRVKSIRFRKAFDKAFAQYKPWKESGVFGHGLFRPYVSEANATKNRLVIVEGELNVLALHSLAVRTSAAGEGGDKYANWIGAVGSSNTLCMQTIAALLKVPGAVKPVVIVQDHDDAGAAMTAALSKFFTIDLVKPPTPGHDIEDHIAGFAARHRDAWASVLKLFSERKRICRPFDALYEQVYQCRQKQGEDDNRKEFEISNDVWKIIVGDLDERGHLYRQSSQGYFFPADQKKLIAQDDSDKELSRLLAKYSLNGSEKVREFIGEALHVETLSTGQPTTVCRLAHYAKDRYTLYVYNHANGIYRVTANGIELVDNGTDGILFLHDGRNETFKTVDEPISADLFPRVVTNQINFEPGQLTLAEQQTVFEWWFLSLFFGSILPTRPLLAFIGPKGSGKSLTLRKVRTILFGSRFQVKNLPATEGDVDAIVTNSSFAAFDNADSKVQWLNDRLAICATGGTFSKRVLFTTNQLVDYPIDCFVGITSRAPHFTRDDVADRLLIHHVHRLAEGQFISEQELMAEALRHRDQLMTLVLRQAQDAIRALKATEGRTYRTGFRMADFATFALRLAEHRGGREYAETIFTKMCEEQAAFTLEGDPLVELLDDFLKYDKTHGVEYTASSLHTELSAIAKFKHIDFPCKSAKSLGSRINNAPHNLQKVFRIKVHTDQHLKIKKYKFWPAACECVSCKEASKIVNGETESVAGFAGFVAGFENIKPSNVTLFTETG